MTSFSQNDRGKRDIINNIIILTKRGTDTIYNVISTKDQKYPSTTIHKHVNVLAKVDRPPYGCLLNTTTHDACSIAMYIHKITLANIIHEQK